jgi:antitoxin component YwqK of YwqJK toxin-antitoxin module
MEKHALNLINLYNEKGEKHGYWEKYCNNGQLWYKSNWVNGKLDGYWEEYYRSGQLFSKGNWVNGKQDGYWEWYRLNGQLMYERNYINGEFVKEKPITELSMDEIAKKFGIPVEQLKIKK